MVLYVEHFYERQAAPSMEEEEDEQDSLAWILLFVDLVYVALLSKLSQVMEYCALSVHTFLFIITIFSVLFVTRLTIDDYACRLGNNDLYHRVMYFIYTFSNFVMALNLNTVHTEVASDAACQANFYSFGFSVGFLISRAVIVVLLGVVIWEDQFRATVLVERARDEENQPAQGQGRFEEKVVQRYKTEVVQSDDKGSGKKVRVLGLCVFVVVCVLCEVHRVRLQVL